MRLRGEMDDPINIIFLEEVKQKFDVKDIAFFKLVVRRILNVLEIFKITCVSKLVQIDDLVSRIFFTNSLTT